MKLYYTGASNINEGQKNPRLSLGNYISSTEVPNEYLNATLNEISKITIDRNQKQVFMLALKNTTGSTATDVTIYYDYPVDNKYKVEIAFVSPTLDACGDLVFEKIPSPESAPLAATFNELNGIGNATNIGDITNGSYVGIWFKATLVAVNIAPRTADEIYADYLAETELPTEEELSFVISYT